MENMYLLRAHTWPFQRYKAGNHVVAPLAVIYTRLAADTRKTRARKTAVPANLLLVAFARVNRVMKGQGS